MRIPMLRDEDAAEIFENAPIDAEGSFHAPRQTHLPIEPDTAQGYYKPSGMFKNRPSMT